MVDRSRSTTPPADTPLADTPPTRATPAAATVERFLGALGLEPRSLTVDEVRREMQLVSAVQAVAAARLLALNERMCEIAANAESPFPIDPRRELCRHGGMRRHDARSLDTQAAAAEAAPALGRLLAEGATTAAHLDALGQALQIAGDGCNELLERVDQIAQRARTATADDFRTYVKRLARDAQPDEGVAHFEQQRRRTFCRLWSDDDGMTRLSAAFDPERGAAIAGVLDRHVEAMFHSGDHDRRDASGLVVAPGVDPNDHRRAVALHALCTRSTAAENSGCTAAPAQSDARPVRAEVVVHVDLQTLASGLHRHGVCRTGQGASIPPATARRLACEADIIPVVLDGRSVPLDVGRSKRLATVHQRRALEAVHDSCAMPDCDVGFGRCVIHHLSPWELGGPTDIANLVPLCTGHHHAVHEGGWTISLDPTTRVVTAAPPLGRRTGHRDDHRADHGSVRPTRHVA